MPLWVSDGSVVSLKLSFRDSLESLASCTGTRFCKRSAVSWRVVAWSSSISFRTAIPICAPTELLGKGWSSVLLAHVLDVSKSFGLSTEHWSSSMTSTDAIWPLSWFSLSPSSLASDESDQLLLCSILWHAWIEIDSYSLPSSIVSLTFLFGDTITLSS